MCGLWLIGQLSLADDWSEWFDCPGAKGETREWADADGRASFVLQLVNFSGPAFCKKGARRPFAEIR